jgi:hypothetical protein
MALTSKKDRVPGIDDLASLVEQVNKTHDSFYVIKRMEESPSYKRMIKITDTLRKPFVKVQPKRDVFGLFLEQQKNILEMNFALASMTLHYNRTLHQFTEGTNARITAHDKSIEEKLRCQDLLPQLRVDYITLQEELEGFDRSKDPIGYNSKLREFRATRDEYLDMRGSWERSSYKDKNLSGRIQDLTSREEVFKKQLQNTMLLSEQVHSYQEELDDNVSHWIGSKDLAEGASYLMQGVSVLDEYNREMNSVFEHSVRELVAAVRHQKVDDIVYGSDAVHVANEELESLSRERAIQYAKT